MVNWTKSRTCSRSQCLTVSGSDSSGRHRTRIFPVMIASPIPLPWLELSLKKGDRSRSHHPVPLHCGHPKLPRFFARPIASLLRFRRPRRVYRSSFEQRKALVRRGLSVAGRCVMAHARSALLAPFFAYESGPDVVPFEYKV
jgi:hypothetical protein